MHAETLELLKQESDLDILNYILNRMGLPAELYRGYRCTNVLETENLGGDRVYFYFHKDGKATGEFEAYRGYPAA